MFCPSGADTARVLLAKTFKYSNDLVPSHRKRNLYV